MILSSVRFGMYFSGSGGDGGSGNQGGKGGLGGTRPKKAKLVQDEDSGSGPDAGSGTKQPTKDPKALGGSRPKK